jgi:hypothetical protein
VTGGGAGKIFTVVITWQPIWSYTVIVVMPTGSPVAVREFPESEPGVGLHVIVGLTEAEPAQVNDAADKVLVHPG